MSPRQNRTPLFHARLLKERLAGHVFPADLAERHAILKSWVLALRTGKLDSAKEVSLHGDFLGDVFGRALGYRTVTTSGAGGWEISAEKTMGGGGKHHREHVRPQEQISPRTRMEELLHRLGIGRANGFENVQPFLTPPPEST